MKTIPLEELSESVQPYYKKGTEAINNNNTPYALDLFEMALNIEPNAGNIRTLFLELAWIGYQKEKPSLLIRVNNIIRYIIAIVCGKNASKTSLKLIQSCIKREPTQIRYIRFYSELLRQNKWFKESIGVLEFMNRTNLADLSILLTLADHYRKTEEYELEYECREKIVELQPNNAIASKELKNAAARLTMGKEGWKKSALNRMDQYSQQIKNNPADDSTRIKLADEYTQSREYEKALQILNESPNIDSNFVFLKKINSIHELQLNFKLAKAEDDQQESVISQLREDLIQLKINQYQLNIEMNPEDLQLKFELGKLLFNNGKFDDAFIYFQYATHSSKRKIRATIYQSKCLIGLNRSTEAKKLLEHLLSTNITTPADIKLIQSELDNLGTC